MIFIQPGLLDDLRRRGMMAPALVLRDFRCWALWWTALMSGSAAAVVGLATARRRR
jgi:hypothetical protein